MDLSSLGMRIKSARKEQGLTLEVLSEKVGISRNFLWEIEAGRKAPALPTLYSLGVTLNISVDYLLGLSPEKKGIAGQSRVTERELEISRIISRINDYELKELLLVSGIISNLSEYLGHK